MTIIKEFNFIENYIRPLDQENSIKNSQNFQDDVAFLNEDIVVSKDIMVEDVHFKISDGASNIANRLLRSNLSDIAASGCKPNFYMLGITISKNINENFLQEFSLALKELNAEFNISLIGGDTTKNSEKLFLSLTIFGKNDHKNNSLSRKNAKINDLIYVSGYIGDAFLGRKLIEKEIIEKNENNKNYLIARYYKPDPKIELGKILLKDNLSNCAIDVSDGLLADLKHVCKSSKLKAIIDFNKIPFSKSAKNLLKNNSKYSLLDLCGAGDDYELIFTSNAKNKEKIEELAKYLNINLTNIGFLDQNNLETSNLKLLNGKNEIKITNFGYEH